MEYPWKSSPCALKYKSPDAVSFDTIWNKWSNRLSSRAPVSSFVRKNVVPSWESIVALENDWNVCICWVNMCVIWTRESGSLSNTRKFCNGTGTKSNRGASANGNAFAGVVSGGGLFFGAGLAMPGGVARVARLRREPRCTHQTQAKNDAKRWAKMTTESNKLSN